MVSSTPSSVLTATVDSVEPPVSVVSVTSASLVPLDDVALTSDTSVDEVWSVPSDETVEMPVDSVAPSLEPSVDISDV